MSLLNEISETLLNLLCIRGVNHKKIYLAAINFGPRKKKLSNLEEFCRGEYFADKGRCD